MEIYGVVKLEQTSVIMYAFPLHVYSTIHAFAHNKPPTDTVCKHYMNLHQSNLPVRHGCLQLSGACWWVDAPG